MPLSAFVSAQGEREASAAPTRTQQERSGREVFAEACATCHGVAGQGRIGPSLVGNENLDRSDYVLALILRGGNGMPPFQHRLSENEITSVASFVRTSWGNAFGGVGVDRLAELWWQGASDTESLYERVCARCHASDGGGLIGPALAGNENLADPQYVTGKILHGQGGMPAFADLLDNDDVEALASFVRNSFGNGFGPVPAGVADRLTLRDERTRGELIASARPEGSRLAVIGPDGKSHFVSRSASHHLTDLSPGRYQVSASKEGHRAAVASVLVEPGGLSSLALELPAADASDDSTGATVKREFRWLNPFDAALGQENEDKREYLRSCALCHGPEGGGGVGPMLAGNANLQNDDFILERILNGGSGMPPFRQRLSDHAIAAVASHERTGWGNAYGRIELSQVASRVGDSEAVNVTAMIDEGVEIYETNCAICHGGVGARGLAPALAGNPDLEDLPYVVSRIVMGGGGMPPFNEVLSSEEIASVATALRMRWGNGFGNVSIEEAQNYHGGPSSRAPQ